MLCPGQNSQRLAQQCGTQAPQKDASGGQSASTSKVNTRKRKLADASSEAGTAAAIAAATSSTAVEAPAARQATTAPLHSQQSVSTSNAAPAEANLTVAQPASKGQTGNKEASQAKTVGKDQSQAKRRSSRRHVGGINDAQGSCAVAAEGAAASAGDQQQSTDKANQHSSKLPDVQGATPDDTERVAEAAPASAGRSAFRESARKEAGRLQTQSEVLGEPAGQDRNVAAPHPAAAGSSAGRRTRSGSVGHSDMKASITAGEPSGSHEKHSDAGQSLAGEVVGSDRDKRLSARRQPAALKPKSKLGRGKQTLSCQCLQSQHPMVSCAHAL